MAWQAINPTKDRAKTLVVFVKLLIARQEVEEDSPLGKKGAENIPRRLE
jgi:hypothetical protein